MPKNERKKSDDKVYDWTKAEMLDAFVRTSCDEGIKVVFVKSPVHSALYQISDTYLSDSVFGTIASRYQVPVLNYYTSRICMDTANFYNYTHLNKRGSELFTMELCHDLDSIGVKAALN